MSSHHIWLRDHCRCPECFHPVTKQRLHSTFEIPADVKPEGVQATPGGLRATWPSQHVSVYPWSWLWTNAYDRPRTADDRRSVSPALWGAEISEHPPTVPYDGVMDPSDRGLLDWLSKIERWGFCFVSGVPVSTDATEELCKRIGFIRETQYGKFWDFTSDLAKGDTAYTTLALGAHTDNTYFTDPCGIQLFHLLSHTDGSGGATLLVDGFAAAARLKADRPDAYRLLAEVPVPAHAAGDPGELYRPYPPAGYPVLGHDAAGALVQVRWNNDDRSVMRSVAPERVEAWYDAIRTWNEYITAPEAEYWVQLQPGTVVAIDNHRVMHGRSAFNGKRRMCGAYIGVDEYRSKLAVLKEKFSPPDSPEALMPEGRSIWHPYL
ncbi:Trimethyllysine dioxygenase [Punctularia strigosozonata HHB-11173 SS5]|uniref:Trimethyllysine dioxygenase n=1 Tax=Punctularia strigosozonata (strain HHB-11173) TaxID=741275 RepID=UPI000441802B|nr:Trimethyllysine dioxygenase [Punctularia strigosozonata HHB-11173 SS5]EIN09855.1 Trimethyllysine dioxygenase [Punctularia strigosozonata HHB-11173 SS5]